MVLSDPQMLFVKDLSFRYPGIGEERGRSVHDGLSLTVEAGGMTVLFGAADQGKTTLARIIAGLVPRFTGGTLSGNVLLAGADIRHSPPYELMNDVGVVSQDSDEQIFTTRCDTEIAFALESLGVPRPQIVERVGECLRRMGLFEMRARNPSTLSGGEKKRLLVACLTAIRPKLWILDESLEELDLSWKGTILDTLAGSGAAALVLDSRWSDLLAERGRSFALLSGGQIVSEAKSGNAPALQQALSREGILPREARRAGRDVRAEVQLKVEGLQFRFPESDGFSMGIESLELRSGEICSLLGSNGSGKTTLGRILCGLLAPQAGAIMLRAGSGFRATSMEDRNGRVGYLFQNPDHQIYLPTVRDELSLSLRRQGLSRGDIDEQIEEVVELFSLPDPASPPALMSYGGRRRLQAAISYLLAREILILDEIDSGLSCREVERLLDALFLRKPGILLITHDMALAKSVSDRALVMQGGRLAGDFRSGAFDRLDIPASGALRP